MWYLKTIIILFVSLSCWGKEKKTNDDLSELLDSPSISKKITLESHRKTSKTSKKKSHRMKSHKPKREHKKKSKKSQKKNKSSEKGTLGMSSQQKATSVAGSSKEVGKKIEARKGKIIWYEPQGKVGSTLYSTIVEFAGKTDPYTRIKIDVDNIIYVKKEKKGLKLPKPSVPPITTANKKGLFILTVELLNGVCQIPVIIKTNDGKVKQYLFLANISNKKVKLSTKTLRKKLRRRKYAPLKKYFYVLAKAGGGLPAKTYTPEGLLTLESSQVSFPFLGLEGIFKVGRWQASLAFSQWAEKVQIKNDQVQNGTANKSQMVVTLDGGYRLSRRFKFLRLHMGLSMEIQPLYMETSSKELSLIDNTFYLGTLGISKVFRVTKRSFLFHKLDFKPPFLMDTS
ncbi:MAG: hypothetical protein D6797_08430, partial [Bdellovibrio sp.]